MNEKHSYLYQSLSFLILGYCMVSLFRWAVFDATWTGASPESCQVGGYCWIYVQKHVSLLFFGFYPTDLTSRVLFFFFSVATLALIRMFATNKRSILIVNGLIWLHPTVALIYLIGGFWGLEVVDTSDWGGLFLSIWLTLFCFSWALPLGLGLALIRRSKFIFLRTVGTLIVEVMRSLPLILVLFIFTYWQPITVLAHLEISKVFIVAFALTIFAAVYIAEIFRAGLDTFPKEEVLVAQSIGLTSRQMLFLIILPQTVRQMMPSFVNILIGMFKDTTLVVFVGLFDFLAMIDVTTHSAKWLPSILDAVIFVMFIYWLLCYCTSRFSETIER